MDDHAQYEIRVFADAIYEIMYEIAPNIMETWKSSQMKAVKLTAEEIKIMSNCISVNDQIDKPEGWSTRRFDAFMSKLKALIYK
jgi:thymidylate synthase (FAD)